MTEVRYKVSFGSARRRPRCTGPLLGKSLTKAEASAQEAESRPQMPVSRIARLLALAYYLERQVEAGAIEDYAEAARRLGVSRARIAQLSGLLNLSPTVQQAVLTGELRLAERSLRRMANGENWHEQLQLLAGRGTAPRAGPKTTNDESDRETGGDFSGCRDEEASAPDPLL